MAEPITAFSDVTAEWLTERLRANGHLRNEHVTEVVVDVRNSEVARLAVTYSGVAEDLPTGFFLKIGGEDECADLEVLFHRDMVSLMENPPTVPTFDLAHDPDSTRAHMLSRDVSKTHYHHGNSTPETTLKVDCVCMADCLARFHAFWWDHAGLGIDFCGFPVADNVLFFHGVSGYEGRLARAVDIMGDRISPDQVAIYERALRSFPFSDLRGNKRLSPGNRLTVIHGDVLFDNVLFPRNATVDPVYLVDWALREIRVGTDDLANFGLLWFSDPSTGLTRDLVRRYYDGLVSSGVEDYTWEDCWHDYRLSTIRTLFIPICSFRDSEYSWRNWERSLASYRDLDCEELLAT